MNSECEVKRGETPSAWAPNLDVADQKAKSQVPTPSPVTDKRLQGLSQVR